MDAAKKIPAVETANQKRQFGQLNIEKKQALELSEYLAFVEICLLHNKRELALETTEELNLRYRNSESLLIKILLGELEDYLRSNRKTARQLLTLNTLNMTLNARIHLN